MTAIKELRSFLEKLHENYAEELLELIGKDYKEHEKIILDEKIDLILSIKSKLLELAKKDLNRIDTHGTKELDSEFLRKAEKFLDYTIELRKDFEEMVGE